MVSSRGELIVRQLIVLSQCVGAIFILLPQSLEAGLLFAELSLHRGNRCSQCRGRRVGMERALGISHRRRDAVGLTLSGLNSSDTGREQNFISLAIEKFTDVFRCGPESVDIACPAHTFMRIFRRLLDWKHTRRLPNSIVDSNVEWLGGIDIGGSRILTGGFDRASLVVVDFGKIAGVKTYFIAANVGYPNLVGLVVEWGIAKIVNVGSICPS
ncbi:hypothetical protein HG531_009877 [Fusarium graminearum]|nr:hypothetical protein HG531_009877 [Fusarium graminearum]